MARQPLTPSQKRFQRRSFIVSLVAGAILVAFFFATKPLMPLGPRRPDDTLAVVAAFLMLHMGLISAFVHSTNPKDAVVQRQRFAQVATCMAAGGVLLLPLFGERFIDPVLNFAIIIALNTVSLFAIWLIWRAADELARSLMKDSYVASYLVTVTALLIYAAGERLGLLGGVTAWGALAFATLVSIPCSFWVIYRRGLSQPPSDE